MYTGLGGEIVEVNDSLGDDPSAVNSDPYGAGWLVKIKVSDPSAFESLMDSGEYDKKPSA